MEWKTRIGDSGREGTVIRGYDLEELIGKLTFTEMIFLELTGRIPKRQEQEMLDAILVSCVEHGIAVPSITAARTVFSGGSGITAGIAAGILSIGEHHGGAIEEAARIMQENIARRAAEIVREMKEKGRRMPGYGHKIYTADPRTLRLLQIARKNRIAGKHVSLALEIEKELEKSAGRKLCLNVDGCIAAIISDMGFDWRLGKAFFIIPRTAGIAAHVHEEWTEGKPFRRLQEGEYEYIGEKKRRIK